MGYQKPESFADVKGYTHISFLLQGAYQNHCQNNNISVNCVDENLIVAIVSSVVNM